jgi:hypothetical protein
VSADVLSRVRAAIAAGLASPAGKAGAPLADFREVPAVHQTLIAETDGLGGYGGYYRLFGSASSPRPIARWNEEATWKFAWGGLLADFLAFGETGFGDQYAYRRSELARGVASVYVLDANLMEPDPCGSTFEEFLQLELLPNLTAPTDEHVVGARQRLGPLGVNETCVFSPSPLVCGFESYDHLMKLPSATALVFNGDLATQLAQRPGKAPVAVRPYVDELRRARLRVVY